MPAGVAIAGLGRAVGKFLQPSIQAQRAKMLGTAARKKAGKTEAKRRRKRGKRPTRREGPMARGGRKLATGGIILGAVVGTALLGAVLLAGGK